MKKPYKTVILKLSGEALHDSNSNSILDAKKLNDIGKLVQDLKSLNVRVGIVTGAGNIFRGRIAHEERGHAALPRMAVQPRALSDAQAAGLR